MIDQLFELVKKLSIVAGSAVDDYRHSRLLILASRNR